MLTYPFIMPFSSRFFIFLDIVGLLEFVNLDSSVMVIRLFVDRICNISRSSLSLNLTLFGVKTFYTQYARALHIKMRLNRFQ